MNRKWISLIIWIVTFQALGSLLGYLTQANLISWYADLNKSSLTPPGYVFGIVWTALYLLLAVIGWYLANRRHLPIYKNAFILYSIQMLMNWAWTPLFFQLHWLVLSFLWIITITLINGVMIVYLRNQARNISLLLIPYFLWLSFATYLNGMIWILN